MFGSAFGGRRGGGRSQPGRGSDLQYNMTISLDEAFEGKTTQIKVPSAESCSTCSGSGAKPGTASPMTCGTCGGRGRVRTQNGIFAMERGCLTRQGQGQVISDPCRSCGGAGKVAKDKLSVNIPAGVEDGTRIRLSGEGELASAAVLRATSTSFSTSAITTCSSVRPNTCSSPCRFR